mmetsp:Transcript_34394/g.90458  ORF Transcript_34394/g.90458 Transcript_34394/m.90458 type:complete len:205 (-) Transcript_34394:86-700(-)
MTSRRRSASRAPRGSRRSSSTHASIRPQARTSRSSRGLSSSESRPSRPSTSRRACTIASCSRPRAQWNGSTPTACALDAPPRAAPLSRRSERLAFGAHSRWGRRPGAASGHAHACRASSVLRREVGAANVVAESLGGPHRAGHPSMRRAQVGCGRSDAGCKRWCLPLCACVRVRLGRIYCPRFRGMMSRRLTHSTHDLWIWNGL